MGDGVHMGPVPLTNRARKVVTGIEKLCSRGSVGMRIFVEELKHFHLEFRKFCSQP